MNFERISGFSNFWLRYGNTLNIEHLSGPMKACFFCKLWQKNLVLHDLVHHLPHQVGQVELVNLPQKVGQVELVNVHGEVHYVLKVKIYAV